MHNDYMTYICPNIKDGQFMTSVHIYCVNFEEWA